VPGIYAFDDFEFDTGKLELTRAGQHTRANTLTLRLLGVLVESAGHIVTKQELLERVWDGRRVSQNVVTVAMTRLRRSLGYSQGMNDLVVNVHGRGYRFTREVVRRDPVQEAVPPGQPLRLAAAPFVGREGVLGHLRAALSEARNGSGSVILLTGEPGIGKTRVAEVFGREAVALGLPVAWGYCREVGDTPPLWPFANLLRELFAHLALDLSEPRFAALVPELGRLLPELVSSPRPPAFAQLAADSGPLACKHRVFDAIARALALASERSPCVLVLDDLHRADPASLELLNYFIDEIPRTRLLLVAALRNRPGASSETLSRVLGHRNATRLALPRLSEMHVGSYLQAVLGSSNAQLRRAVFANCEGNPFFMSELARQVRASESVDPQQIRVPEAALDVVRQRLAGLDEHVRAALSAAAVIGRNFSLPVLQAVTGTDSSTSMAHLDVAIAAEVVLPKRDSRVEFVFAHELLRAVLYDALSPADRRSCHLRVAQALEVRGAHGDDVPPADLAYHSRAALPLGDLRKTVRYCVDACMAAVNVFAYGDAARCLQHALEALDMLEKPSPRVRIQLLLHQALLTRAQSARAFAPLIARVFQLAREHNESNVLARAAMLHDPYPGLPPLAGSVAAFRDALKCLEAESGEPTLRATMLARLAASPPAAFDAAEARALITRAQALASTSPEVLDRFSVRVGELYLFGGPANRERAKQLLHELREICRENPTMLTIPPVMLELHTALAALQAGEVSTMEAALERATTRCRDLDSELLWHFERFNALVRYRSGDGSTSRRVLEALHDRSRQQGIAGTELFCAYDEALLFSASADTRPHVLPALSPDDGDRPNLWSMKLRALHAIGRTTEARAALHRVPASRLAALPCDRDYLGTLGALARVAVDLGELEYVEALYPLLAPYPEHFAVNASFVCEGSVSGLLAQLARALGRPNEALKHARVAAEIEPRMGSIACVPVPKP
jgi:DNA-binding winged helix-turn-helix (wHTH) protein/tetratricopeptide (TPR) repeat protein